MANLTLAPICTQYGSSSSISRSPSPNRALADDYKSPPLSPALLPSPFPRTSLEFTNDKLLPTSFNTSERADASRKPRRRQLMIVLCSLLLLFASWILAKGSISKERPGLSYAMAGTQSELGVNSEAAKVSKLAMRTLPVVEHGSEDREGFLEDIESASESNESVEEDVEEDEEQGGDEEEEEGDADALSKKLKRRTNRSRRINRRASL